MNLAAPGPTAEDQLWSGASDDELVGRPVTGLTEWLSLRAGRPAAFIGVPADGVACDSALSDGLRAELDRIRIEDDVLVTEEGHEAITSDVGVPT